MEIQWQSDVDAALAQAKKVGKPLLLDFTAAPM
ncbi:MAG TPA: thioredoxin family protein [Thermoanaerobaculia bacterium]